ncbi:Gfo/Idh/MocA family oxidoreductase [Calidifontibacter sp. DB0510]|uniref:Gfo/Idh/MocA family oxidoreductase n=1 Tax=Metallococcus carri TaxID=1656884 RepID=A0A967B5C5_9MICO|nr:Gfo/Idh/MocA family oxidoreductase [Metallococcus carri]NHN54926.1 Gfo/Idh/MocA family oxidoreductase [Metallococcus carri]NOP37272.1 Gfo/Idh/MocA family oxidoreductase [Calidifontibacter sp. DB2511S]
MRIGVAGVGRIGAFHAATLAQTPGVAEVVVADVQPGAAEAAAERLGVRAVGSVEELLAAGLDGFVIAAATSVHDPLLRAGLAAGVPTFCEKPVAGTLAESVDLVEAERAASVPVQVGFQRRFDRGYRAARDAVQAGDLGWLHTVRLNTFDQSPPPAAYIPTSGGIFRDCSVHDFDILRFVTGREVASVFATGGNQGEAFFAEADDVDTGAALLTLDDGTMALASATRYNGGGHDVRMELMGSRASLGVGLDDSLVMRSAEGDLPWPAGPVKTTFMERFEPAYRAELAAFVEVAAGRMPSPCTVADALQAFRIAEACEISRHEHRPVELAEIAAPQGTQQVHAPG